MDTKDHPVITVLGDNKRYMVPIYQRRYSWREDRWTAFWDDVVSKSEEALASEGKPKFKHYMGALIIAPGTDGYVVGVTPRVQVVDGQQRLSTFELFLAALREVGNQKGFTELSESIENYTFNQLKTGDKDPETKFKIAPTPEDKKVFFDIMEGNWNAVRTAHSDAFYKNGNIIFGKAPLAIRAWSFFIEKIRDYAQYGIYDLDDGLPSPDDETTQRTRLEFLLQALLNHLKLVVITLDENDDAQVIFETLNSKAEPLLAMDLVRNNIFHRAQALGEAPEKLFESKWKLLEGPFWKADSPRAKPRRPRIDHFLSHALTAQTGKEVSLRELYAEYRAFSRPKGVPRFQTVEGELDALLQFTPSYKMLEEPNADSSIGRLGTKLNLWEVTTVYPLVFCIAVADVEEAAKDVLYRLIYSYLVRRAICGLTPKNLNKTFQRIVGTFLENGVSRKTFIEAFADQAGPAVRFPTDDEFESAIREKPVYQTILKKERLTDILWELELRLRDKFSVGTPRPLGMSIEHVLPQHWTEHWLLPDGRKAPSDLVTGADETMLAAIAARTGVLHTLGNLTLITAPGNSAASNSGFTEKKNWLKKSLLALNLAIIEDREVWDLPEISERANSLSLRAKAIWPSLTAEQIAPM